MKYRFLFAIFLLSLLLAVSFTPGLAKNVKINLEGEIIALDEVARTLTLQTEDLAVYLVRFTPEADFAFTANDIGLRVHVKGELQEDGSILAGWVKPVDGLEDEIPEEETNKADSAYCSDAKESAHPVISVLAERFGKDVTELMGYFCDGLGVGQIFLALQTEKITGAAYGDLLTSRMAGQGWGQIWKGVGEHGKPKGDAHIPPGLAKDKIPPGQAKDKEKPPKGDK